MGGEALSTEEQATSIPCVCVGGGGYVSMLLSNTLLPQAMYNNDPTVVFLVVHLKPKFLFVTVRCTSYFQVSLI